MLRKHEVHMVLLQRAMEVSNKQDESHQEEDFQRSLINLIMEHYLVSHESGEIKMAALMAYIDDSVHEIKADLLEIVGK